MPTKLRVVAAVLLLVIVASGGYLLLTGGKDSSKTSTEAAQQTTPPPKKETQLAQDAGRYVAYSADAVMQAKGQRILFFHAPWCPQCRKLESSIEAGNVPGGVTIFKVDYDSNQTLRQKYGVTIQTTLVLLDEKGNELKKYVAYDQPSLDAVVKNLL